MLEPSKNRFMEGPVSQRWQLTQWQKGCQQFLLCFCVLAYDRLNGSWVKNTFICAPFQMFCFLLGALQTSRNGRWQAQKASFCASLFKSTHGCLRRRPTQTRLNASQETILVNLTQWRWNFTQHIQLSVDLSFDKHGKPTHKKSEGGGGNHFNWKQL